MKIKFHYNIGWDAWEVYVYDEQRQSQTKIPYKVELKIEKGTEADNSKFLEPSVRIPSWQFEQMGLLSGLIEGLAEAGLLKSASSLENELRATKAHLVDLQKTHDALLQRFSKDGNN